MLALEGGRKAHINFLAPSLALSFGGNLHGAWNSVRVIMFGTYYCSGYT